MMEAETYDDLHINQRMEAGVDRIRGVDSGLAYATGDPCDAAFFNELARRWNTHHELIAAIKGLLAQVEGPAMVHGDGRGADGKKIGLSGDEFISLRAERIDLARAAIARATEGR